MLTSANCVRLYSSSPTDDCWASMMCSYECGISVGEKKSSVLLSLADHDNIVILKSIKTIILLLWQRSVIGSNENDDRNWTSNGTAARDPSALHPSGDWRVPIINIMLLLNIVAMLQWQQVRTLDSWCYTIIFSMVLLLISLSTNENNVTFKIYYNNNIYCDTWFLSFKHRLNV